MVADLWIAQDELRLGDDTVATVLAQTALEHALGGPGGSDWRVRTPSDQTVVATVVPQARAETTLRLRLQQALEATNEAALSDDEE